MSVKSGFDHKPSSLMYGQDISACPFPFRLRGFSTLTMLNIINREVIQICHIYSVIGSTYRYLRQSWKYNTYLNWKIINIMDKYAIRNIAQGSKGCKTWLCSVFSLSNSVQYKLFLLHCLSCISTGNVSIWKLMKS